MRFMLCAKSIMVHRFMISGRAALGSELVDVLTGIPAVDRLRQLLELVARAKLSISMITPPTAIQCVDLLGS